MALAKYTISSGYWKKISAAGQTGSAWIKETENGKTPMVAIAHTNSVQSPTDDIPLASAVNLDRDIAYYLPKDFSVSSILEADSPDDVFYATVFGTDETGRIIVDFAGIG